MYNFIYFLRSLDAFFYAKKALFCTYFKEYHPENMSILELIYTDKLESDAFY